MSHCQDRFDALGEIRTVVKKGSLHAILHLLSVSNQHSKQHDIT